MYHCHLKFYLTGHRGRAFSIIKEMPPLECFTHTFVESGGPESSLAAGADVIFVETGGMDACAAVRELAAAKRDDAALIVLADQAQIKLLEGELRKLTDIWTLPMDEEETRFRFMRWQQACKREKDFWQTSHYLDAAIDCSPNLIWFKDKNGIHEKVNNSFCRTVNKTKQQVEGRHHAYIWDMNRDDSVCIESEQRVMERRETMVSEERIMTDKGLRLLTAYKSPLYDLDGSVMGTVGVALDVTQERNYEQEIVNKNHTLETIFNTVDCGILSHTLDGSRVIDANPMALEILGYSDKDEMEADGFQMVAATVVDEDKPILREAIGNLRPGGDSVSVEYRVRNKDGRLRHVMGSIKLIEENGELLCQRFLVDCTARKLDEKRREWWQEQLVQALSSDYNQVCYFNLDTGWGGPLRTHVCKYGVVDEVFNPSRPVREGLEKYIRLCVHNDDREFMRHAMSPEKLREELGEKPTYTVHYRTDCAGHTHHFQMKAVRTGDWDESPVAVLGFRNVDDEIRSETERRNQLEDALVQANRANQAKSAFLSNMSHDMRTPMNAIVGFTSLAISHIDQKGLVEEYLGKIMSSGNHLLSLINDVLDMSRIESGKLHLDEAPCNLSEIIHGLQNIVQADIRAKRMELTVHTGGIVNEYIYCDRLRLNQVLLNILSNSVKYTGAGGSVDFTVVERPGAAADHACYEFKIKDNGIGMSGDFVEHIFDPFERERNTTISGIQGTGLGMAITKNIVDMMNGSIEVRSAQGVGTEFVVNLVFRLCQSVHDEETVVKEPVQRRTGRILLAEDNHLNQEIAEAILSDAGFSVEIAENGQIALDMLKSSRPGYYQLVLMDVQMPVMDGYHATRAIRALEDPDLSGIPVIAMTANAFEEDRSEAFKSGMNGHIAKPVDMKVLFDTLDRLLAGTVPESQNCYETVTDCYGLPQKACKSGEYSI